MKKTLTEKETGREELRAISNMLDWCTESSLDGYSLEQLVTLGRAWRASEWDIPIHKWTDRQRREAALRGIPPRWADEDKPVYSRLDNGTARWRWRSLPSNLPRVPAREAARAEAARVRRGFGP